jgi:methylated-DNA-protein-cysteine methyltransferase-like protein
MDKTFREAVWDVVAGIPAGYVLTYGQVAALAGLPNAARRVSGALGQAPKNKPVPWHRVINAQGKISIPKESRWYLRQKDLLQEEGVVIIKGKIDLQRFGWSGVVDHLMWQPPDDN